MHYEYHSIDGFSMQIKTHSSELQGQGGSTTQRTPHVSILQEQTLKMPQLTSLLHLRFTTPDNKRSL